MDLKTKCNVVSWMGTLKQKKDIKNWYFQTLRGA